MPAQPHTTTPAHAPHGAAPIFWPALWTLVLAKLVLHLVTHEGYGYFRDELYYLACSRHLDWGYVDHPPLSIALLAMVRGLLGDGLLALRLLPAVAGAAMVGLTGGFAARLGGGRWSQALAMLGACIAPVYLAISHFYSMNIFDILLWSLAVWQLLGILQRPVDDTSQPRRWIVLGIVLGLGLLNKISVLWLGAGLTVGLVATPARRWLRTPWPWLSGAVSMALFAPYLIWQQLHGWPTLEFMANATGQKMVEKSLWMFWGEQLTSMHPFNGALWVSGCLYLMLSKRLRDVRPLGWIFLAVAAILMLSGTSRASYLSPAYPWLLAAGAVWLETVLRPTGWRRGVWAVVGLVWLTAGAALAPLALPVLPVDGYIAYAEDLGVAPSTSEKKELAELPQFYADMHGWPEIVDEVARVFETLSEAEQQRTAIVATNYGVTGAIDHFGRELGLPAAWSQHNNYFFWGPVDGVEPLPEVVIYVGSSRQDLLEAFAEVEQAGTTDCGYCMPYENQRPIFVCRGFRSDDVAGTWAAGKHFD